MKNREMLQLLLEESGAILKGHFKLTSGRHSNIYFEKFRVIENPKALSALCAEIAEHFKDQVDLVAGPTTGGIIIAFEVARQMGLNAVYVETVDGKKTLRRNATVPENARILIVDDVLTTGLSVEETAQAITEAGGVVAGVGVLIDRAPTEPDFGAPYFASYKVVAESWDESEIPDWLNSIPVTKPGTRA
ncbi:MAG: orotate phosphoribosyltransferase [Fimbriimonadaceae bacterium]